MKKILFLLLLITFNSNAQDFALKINPISPFINGIEFSFESKSNSDAKSSVEFVASFLDYTDNNTKNNVRAWGAELRYKFLIDKITNGIEGTYIAPTGLLSSGKFNYERNITIYGIGAVLGYQFVFQNVNQNGFLIDLFGGFIYNSVSAYQLNIENVEGFKPRIGVAIGYAF